LAAKPGCSAAHAAVFYTLIQTAKFYDVDQQTWLADGPARSADHPASRIGRDAQGGLQTALSIRN
jgi:hypothetical protein